MGVFSIDGGWTGLDVILKCLSPSLGSITPMCNLSAWIFFFSFLGKSTFHASKYWCCLFPQSQRARHLRDTMRVKWTSQTQTTTPKRHLRPSSPRIMSIGNKGMTDHLAFIGTLIFPNQARSLSPTVQPPKHQFRPSSGKARRDGHEARRTDHRTTGERHEMSRFSLHPSRLLIHVPKNFSRWSLVDLTTNNDTEMEMVVETWLECLIEGG